MKLKFIGEGAPELQLFPENQRRRIFLEAVKRSYRSFATWKGLVIFILLVAASGKIALIFYPSLRDIFADEARGTEFIQCACVVLGLIALGGYQYGAIRKELRRKLAQRADRGEPPGRPDR